MFDVFISYSSKDRQAAFAACTVLETRGIRCWIAPRNVPAGTSWAEAILEAMQQSRVMVLIFSAHANESEQIKREVERAVSRGLPIIPVRLESVLPEKALEYFISSSHWLDAFPPPFEHYLEELAIAVRALLDGKPHDTRLAKQNKPAPSQVRSRLPLIWSVAVVFAAITGALLFLKSTAGADRYSIATFSVPVKFSDANGMDGPLVATHLLDQMNALQSESDVYSLRASDRFTAAAEPTSAFLPANPFRRDVGVSGDVVNADNGWALSVRIAGQGSRSIPILRNDMDTAIKTAAAWIFQQVAPDRYSVILGLRRHTDEETLLLQMARAPQNPDHLWVASKLSEFYFSHGRYREACDVAQEALAETPSFVPVKLDLANCYFGMGQLDLAGTLIAGSAEQLSSSPPSDISPKAIADLLPQLNSRLAEFSGAWLDAISLRSTVRHSPVNYLNRKMRPWDASDYALAHDPYRALLSMKDAGMGIGGEDGGIEDAKAIRQFQSIGFAPSNFFVAIAEDRWADAADDLSIADKAALQFGNVNEIRHRYLWPWLAYALARSGRLSAGQALAAAAPLDCYVCLEMRGRIAAAAHDFDGAGRSYQRAIANAGRLPFAYCDWAAALLARGDVDGAIEKLEAAHQHAPHYADALELWGEAFVAKNRSDLALEKFSDASRYAPNWGRLHLKWGEALVYVGRDHEAREQFTIASGLSLSIYDRKKLEAFEGEYRRRLGPGDHV